MIGNNHGKVVYFKGYRGRAPPGDVTMTITTTTTRLYETLTIIPMEYKVNIFVLLTKVALYVQMTRRRRVVLDASRCQLECVYFTMEYVRCGQIPFVYNNDTAHFLIFQWYFHLSI